MGLRLLGDRCRGLCPGLGSLQHWSWEPEVSLYHEVPGAQPVSSVGKICIQEGPDVVSLLNCLLD